MHASMQTTSLLWVSVPSVTSYIIMEFLRIKFPLFTKGVVLCMPVVSVRISARRWCGVIGCPNAISCRWAPLRSVKCAGHCEGFGVSARWTAFCSGRETHSLYPSAERVYDKSRIARQSTFSAWYPFGRFTCHLSVGRDFCIPIRLRRFWHPYSWGFAFRHSGGSSNRLLSWRSGEHSLYVRPYDVEGLAAAIARTQEPSLRATMIEEGLKWAQRFTEEQMARETMECYRKVLTKET